MRLLTYKYEGYENVGIMDLSEMYVIPLTQFGFCFHDMNELIDDTEIVERLKMIDFESAKERLLYSDVGKCAPIPHPKQDIICLGINYIAHAMEAAKFKNDAFGGERLFPIYFGKRVNEAVGSEQGISAHRNTTKQLDYEVELAVVLGKDAKNIKPEEVLEYILGFTIINDISAREIQTRHQQWYLGKSLDGFTPMGPWIVTKEEISYPPKIRISSKVNGELRQNSNTDLLVFDIDYVISELSQGMTLKAGTIISMGTPAGVGMGMDPPAFLNVGDIVECYIEGIGKLVNTIIE